MKTALLTAERVRDVLDYDPDTGVFTWRQKLNRRMVVGAVAGTALKSGRSAGRRTIHIDQIGEAASRIAWLHFYGEHPKHCIDHINGNPGDDRIANLRDVPPVGNSQNLRRQPRGGTSGLLGATKARRGKWRSAIKVNGKSISLGEFQTAEQAHSAYVSAKRRLHPTCSI